MTIAVTIDVMIDVMIAVMIAATAGPHVVALALAPALPAVKCANLRVTCLIVSNWLPLGSLQSELRC